MFAFSDFIICLEDGRKLLSLKRHLWAVFRLTPDDYRAKWGLPNHYPMVAPNYAARRSALAKRLGLGGSKPRGPIATGVPIQRIPEGVSSKSARAKRLTRPV